MKKEQLKAILKPLIKECVKEAILEEGVLSHLISEVARGVTNTPVQTAPSVEPAQDPMVTRLQRNAFNKEQSNKLHEQKKKLMNAIGTQSYNGVNLFEGTDPAPSQASPRHQAQPLAGHAAGDAGVDISSLFGSVGTHWGAHMDDVKEK